MGNSCRRLIDRVVTQIGLSVTTVLLILVAGCGFLPIPSTASLASTASVAVSADQSLDVALGSGAAQLAISTWAMYRLSDNSLLSRVRFGPNGEILEIFDNFVFAQPWLGSQILPDGLPNPTAFPGGQYVSGGYMAEDGDRVGVLGVLHGILLGQHLGTAQLEFYGVRVGDRIDGTMTRTVIIFGVAPFEPPGDAQFEAFALREG